MTLMMRCTRLLALALTITALSGCDGRSTEPSAPPAPQPTLSGTVIDGVGATVRAVGPLSRETVVGADGRYRFAPLQPGTYTLSISLPGFVFTPDTQTVTLATADVVAAPFVSAAPTEGLPNDVAVAIDAEPETPLAPTEVLLPNGQTLSAYAAARGLSLPPLAAASLTSGFVPLAMQQAALEVSGPQQRKNDLVTLMVQAAQRFACGRAPQPCTLWNYAADPADPILRPAQTGLTYVYGGKTPTVRTKSVQDGCPQFTYGLDCSGLISRVAEAAGIRAPDGSANQSRPEAWTLPTDWQLTWKRVDTGPIETGDLVAWPGHIGIAQSSGPAATVAVISATGSPGACATNIRPPRGPRSLTVTQIRRGPPSTVLRLTTTLSGTFDLYLRCSQQTRDAAVLRFRIDNDKGGAFTATGSGFDYDGTPFTATLSGTYDPIANVVAATVSVPGFARSDSFRLTLLQDDTGYFPMTKVLNNGACTLSGRLVRRSADAPVDAPAIPRVMQGPVLPAARLRGPTS